MKPGTPNLKCLSLSPGFIDTALTKGFGAKLGPEEGTVSCIKCPFGDVVSGYYYGSDGLRSPMTRTRDPGMPEYEGEDEETIDRAKYNKTIGKGLSNFPINRPFTSVDLTQVSHPDFRVLDDQSAGTTVRLMQWNILAQALTSQESFPRVPAKYLTWEYRLPLIIDHIRSVDADLIGLCEVDGMPHQQ